MEKVRGKSDKIYDLAVIGDEPAGLWCLRRTMEIHDRLTRSRNPKIPRFPKPNLAWISAGKNRPVALPSLVAKQFGIKAPYPWSFEIATPKSTFLWNRETIQKKFPEISIPTGVKATPENLSALRYVLRTRPEILGFSSGIWRFFGAAEPVSPEGMIWAALLCHSLVWWNAAEKLDSVDGFEKTESTTPFLSLTPDKNWKVEWDGKSLIAKSVLWNTTFETETASAAEFPVVIPTQTSELPASPAPLILYFDSEEIPEANTEVWPFEISTPKKPTTDDQQASVRFWIREGIDAPEKNLSERMSEGLKRAKLLFPYLDTKAATLHAHEKLRRFPLSTFSVHDPNRSRVFFLPPSHLCHLAYPLGTLKGARDVLHSVLGRTRVKWIRKEASAKSVEL